MRNRDYDLRYRITPVPERHGVQVAMEIRQSRHLLREVSMAMPAERFREVRGDGDVTRDGERIQWLPTKTGGTLNWFVTIDHQRDADSYDACITNDWAIFRGSDVLPAARTRTAKGAKSRTSLGFALPADWSSVTRYFGKDDSYRIHNGDRRFDRPTGWMLLGHIGTRTEKIAGTAVKVSGPTGQSVRRLDILAMLHWTLPYLRRLLPDFPKRLTIISADANMWRGGLSGPQSLFLHADLPLISENGTSALLHEVMHVATGLRSRSRADWIVEGLAEYYSLELLRRSRSISEDRYQRAIVDLRDWGSRVSNLCSRQSTGATTALAVAKIVDLEREIRRNSSSRNGVDQVLVALVAADRPVSVKSLREAAARVNGKPSETLASGALPGCTD